MNRKYGIFFGAVAIALLMTSMSFVSVNAGLVPETSTISSSVTTVSLSVTIVGSGSVTKNPNQYGYGSVVQLTAVPSDGWSFSGWSGALSGSQNPKNITMNGNKAVTATFVKNNVNIDQSILSGSEQRQILSDSLNYVNEPENRILVQEIIKLMDTRGFVDDNDVQQIISANNLGLSAGIWHTIETGPNCGGYANCIRKPISIFPCLFLPVACLFWEVCYQKIGTINPCYPSIYIDGYHITYDCSGYAIGFVGGYINGIPEGVIIHGKALVVSW